MNTVDGQAGGYPSASEREKSALRLCPWPRRANSKRPYLFIVIGSSMAPSLRRVSEILKGDSSPLNKVRPSLNDFSLAERFWRWEGRVGGTKRAGGASPAPSPLVPPLPAQGTPFSERVREGSAPLRQPPPGDEVREWSAPCPPPSPPPPRTRYPVLREWSAPPTGLHYGPHPPAPAPTPMLSKARTL